VTVSSETHVAPRLSITRNRLSLEMILATLAAGNGVDTGCQRIPSELVRRLAEPTARNFPCDPVMMEAFIEWERDDHCKPSEEAKSSEEELPRNRVPAIA